MKYARADAELLSAALVNRYQVPQDQITLLTNENLLQLERGISDRLGLIGADGKLVVFFSGHACKDADGVVYLGRRISTTSGWTPPDCPGDGS